MRTSTAGEANSSDRAFVSDRSRWRERYARSGERDALFTSISGRAARRIWARELRDTYAAKSEKSLLMRTHAQTAGVSLTAQPLNNITRTAIEGLAAVLGGTQSLHTNSHDEALALPTEAAVRTALRTQQVIAEETGVTNTIDPLAGSYSSST